MFFFQTTNEYVLKIIKINNIFKIFYYHNYSTMKYMKTTFLK